MWKSIMKQIPTIKAGHEVLAQINYCHRSTLDKYRRIEYTIAHVERAMSGAGGSKQRPSSLHPSSMKEQRAKLYSAIREFPEMVSAQRSLCEDVGNRRHGKGDCICLEYDARACELKFLSVGWEGINEKDKLPN